MAEDKQELNLVQHGGIWTDSNLEQSLDWAGESTSDKAAVDQHKVHSPKTKLELEQDLIAASGISADSLSAITTRIERTILKQAGISNQSISQFVQSIIESEMNKVQRWIETQEKRVSELETKQSTDSVKVVQKIDERLSSIEYRIDTIVKSITTHGPEEARMIHEAHKIIMDRKASEEEVGSEPSIYARFEKRAEALEESLRQIEPQAERASRLIIDEKKRSVGVKKKFGKMM